MLVVVPLLLLDDFMADRTMGLGGGISVAFLSADFSPTIVLGTGMDVLELDPILVGMPDLGAGGLNPSAIEHVEEEKCERLFIVFTDASTSHVLMLILPSIDTL